MPAKRLNPPRAPFAKRFWHTFYLVQPVIQFAALLSLLLVFGRCSPLNPSTDKVMPKPPSASGGSGGSDGGGNDESFLRENQISANLKELSDGYLDLATEAGFAVQADGAIEVSRATRESDMKALIARQEKKAKLSNLQIAKFPLLNLALSLEQQRQLLLDGSVRVALHDYLQPLLDDGARRLLFQKLTERMNSDDKLHAEAYLVTTSEVDAAQKVSIRVKISLALLSDDKGYLELRRSNKDNQDAMLLAQAAASRKLAVLLE